MPTVHIIVFVQLWLTVFGGDRIASAQQLQQSTVFIDDTQYQEPARAILVGMPLQLFKGGLERSRATAADGVFQADEEIIFSARFSTPEAGSVKHVAVMPHRDHSAADCERHSSW
jgi:hypothetical protein